MHLSGEHTSPFTPTSEFLITFAALLCSNKMLLSSPHSLSSHTERRQGRQGTSRTQTQGKGFTTLMEQMEAWCLSKLQQICMLRAEFSTLPAQTVKQGGLPSTWDFTAWIKGMWKSPPPLWIQSLCLFCQDKSHIQLFNDMIWAQGDLAKDPHIGRGTTEAREGIWV